MVFCPPFYSISIAILNSWDVGRASGGRKISNLRDAHGTLIVATSQTKLEISMKKLIPSTCLYVSHIYSIAGFEVTQNFNCLQSLITEKESFEF